MRKAIASIFVPILITWASPVFAAGNCFIAKENGKILQEEGDCQSRYAPQSTFKIVLSLIGFDAEILKDETHPSWQYERHYDYYLNACRSEHNPRTWMRDSCLWYSRVLTSKLGMERFREYIAKFRYGNMDVSGDRGRNNGLSHAWVSSSLRISPEEQANFLQGVVEQKLPISQESYKKTKNIMFIQEMWGGWKLYGKTGGGKDGWFVGYIEKEQRRIVFASHIVDNHKSNSPASLKARSAAFTKLFHLIDQLEG